MSSSRFFVRILLKIFLPFFGTKIILVDHESRNLYATSIALLWCFNSCIGSHLITVLNRVLTRFTRFLILVAYYTPWQLPQCSPSTYIPAYFPFFVQFQRFHLPYRGSLLIYFNSISQLLLFTSFSSTFPPFLIIFSLKWIPNHGNALSATLVHLMILKMQSRFTAWVLTTICTRESTWGWFKLWIETTICATTMRHKAKHWPSCFATITTS